MRLAERPLETLTLLLAVASFPFWPLSGPADGCGYASQFDPVCSLQPSGSPAGRMTHTYRLRGAPKEKIYKYFSNKQYEHGLFYFENVSSLYDSVVIMNSVSLCTLDQDPAASGCL